MLRTTMWFRRSKSVFLGKLTRFLYSARNVEIGKNFTADTIPEIIVEPDTPPVQRAHHRPLKLKEG
ncbi:MAG TPA: hypothetical protein PK530_09255, partial [Anaerolineales bacterium]|nr:hypothetical protein [Anaerolineales bacterium]